MIRTAVAIAFLAAVSPALKKCEGKAIPAGDACPVIKRTLYPDCKFSLSREEIDALSEANQIKLDSVKRFFRNCPEAKACMKGK